MEDSAETYGVSGWFRKRYSEDSNLYEKFGSEKRKTGSKQKRQEENRVSENRT